MRVLGLEGKITIEPEMPQAHLEGVKEFLCDWVE